MMKQRYEGDPKIYVDGSGAYLKWVGGQPVMDSGIENCATYALLTRPDWPGNAFIRDPKDRYGSEFLASTERPITISQLNDARSKGERSLVEKMVDDRIAKNVLMTITNPDGPRLAITVIITPPFGIKTELALSKYGPNWEVQIDDPAGAK